MEQSIDRLGGIQRTAAANADDAVNVFLSGNDCAFLHTDIRGIRDDMVPDVGLHLRKSVHKRLEIFLLRQPVIADDHHLFTVQFLDFRSDGHGGSATEQHRAFCGNQKRIHIHSPVNNLVKPCSQTPGNARKMPVICPVPFKGNLIHAAQSKAMESFGALRMVQGSIERCVWSSML